LYLVLLYLPYYGAAVEVKNRAHFILNMKLLV